MITSRIRDFDPQLTIEVNLVCQIFPVIAQRGTQGLLVKTYLAWLKDPKNQMVDLIEFTVSWYNYEKFRRT